MTCDGPICMEGMQWVNYYAGCVGCLDWSVEGTLVNNSEEPIRDVQLDLALMADEKTVLRTAAQAVSLIPAKGGRWPFRVSFGANRGPGPAPTFARPVQITLTMPDGERHTATVNFGAVRVR